MDMNYLPPFLKYSLEEQIRKRNERDTRRANPKTFEDLTGHRDPRDYHPVYKKKFDPFYLIVAGLFIIATWIVHFMIK